MELSYSAFAEQSPFSHLVVVKKPTKLTRFQRAADSIYEYYTDSPLTSVNVDEYSITSLADTVKQLPKYSVFDFIRFMMDSDPDYRHIKVSPINDDMVMTPRVVPKLSIVRNNNLGPYPSSSSSSAQQPRSMFTSESPLSRRTQMPARRVRNDGGDNTNRYDFAIPFTITDVFPNMITNAMRIIDDPLTGSDSSMNTSIDSIVKSIAIQAGSSNAAVNQIENSYAIDLNRQILTAYLAKTLINNTSVSQISRLNDQKISQLAELISNSITRLEEGDDVDMIGGDRNLINVN